MTAALLLESCNQVPIKDEIMYGNKGVIGAVEFHTLTSDAVQLTMEEWMGLLRAEPMICTSVNTFADIKAATEQLRSVCGCCAYDTTKAMEQFFNEVKLVGGNGL